MNSLTSSSISFLKNANNPNDYIPLIQRDSTASDLIKLSKEKQILSVFASGNEGIISPGIMALAPYYDEEIRSIIVVTALDSSQISKDSDGKFVMTTYDNGNYVSAATTYANGLKGVYNFSLAAPGTNINSVNASYNVYDDIFNRLDRNQYRVSSGTSMAAPMVTGAAALVAQKFPFMSGKQIADTLLSTANKDYIAPKIIVKETVTGKSLCDGNVLCFGTKKYTVFYIDNKIPRKEDGSIDEKAVETDLRISNYWESGWKYDRMSGMAAIDDDDYPWVQEVKKEDLFGQGILDIDKALKGIGILDANRLSDADVRSEFGETAVYYALDTKGSDTEFGNDISQRKWEANTHNPEADNLPKNLDNLNVGLIKSGSGVLTLSGANSYEGATVINGGGIRLLSKDSKTAQITGSVYVNSGSTLSGNGVIKQNLTNDNSIIRPGNGDLSDLIVDGTYTQKGQNSKLILDFGNDDNSQLIAKDYSISGGNLEYNPLAQYYTVNKEIKIQLGGLATHIGNFANVEIASNNSISFEIKLDSDKTTINKDPVSIPPIHETEVPSNPQNPTPPSSENVTPPQSEQPNTPSQPVAPSEPNNNQNNNQQAPNNNQNNQQNGNQQSPSNSQNSGSIIVTPVVKPNAYNSNSTTLSQTMRNIRSNVNLSSKYNQFFNTLDSSDSNTYQETMSRIEGNSVFDLTSIITQNHTSFYQNNMLFSINPVSSTLFSYNSNPYDSGIFVASVASDYAIDLGFDSLKPKNYWYINPTYKRYNGNGFDGYQSGVSVNLAHKLDDGIISYGVGAGKSSLDFDIGATAKSSNFDIALNYTHDFESFKLLSGGSFMVSFNENERIVANTLSSDYKSYSSSLQLGVAKDFRHYSIVVTPLGYLGYGKIYQESFKESGGIFAKNYDSINHDLYTVGLGLNLAYEGSDEKK